MHIVTTGTSVAVKRIVEARSSGKYLLINTIFIRISVRTEIFHLN